jgi:hypothetical protein
VAESVEDFSLRRFHPHYGRRNIRKFHWARTSLARLCARTINIKCCFIFQQCLLLFRTEIYKIDRI